MNNYQEAREWLISLLNTTAKPFTPEVDKAMQELWKRRESVFGERRAIVHAFEAVLNYRKEAGFFTPHYFEQQDRLNRLRQEITRRAQALKEYVEKYVMDEQEVLQVLSGVEVWLTNGHFVLTNDRHSDKYVNKDAIYPHTTETSRLCRAIAERFADENIEVVIAPAIGGVKLSDRVAEHLSRVTGHEVLSIYGEKETVAIPDPEGLGRACFAETGNFVIKSSYDKLVVGRRVLVVEDVLTTGGSAKKVVEATRGLGGNVVGLGVLVNRGGITPHDVADVPKLDALISVTLDAWDEDECARTGPCSRNVPINTDVGKGREFLSRKQ